MEAKEKDVAEVCALPSFSINLLIPLLGSVTVGENFAAAYSGVGMSPETTNPLCQNMDRK